MVNWIDVECKQQFQFTGKTYHIVYKLIIYKKKLVYSNKTAPLIIKYIMDNTVTRKQFCLIGCIVILK